MPVFKTPQELVEFFNNLDLDKSTLVFKEDSKPSKASCACEGKGPCQCPPKNNKQQEPITETVVQIADATTRLIVESFSENSEFEFIVEDDATENVFYVKDYEAVENACGTGRVELEHTVMFMNMCEHDDKASLMLDLVVEGKSLKDVPFILAKTDKSPYLGISKKQLV